MVGVDEIVSGQDIGALSQWPPPHQPKKLCSSPVNTAVNIAFSQALTRTHIYRSVSVLICSEIHFIPFVLCCYFISIFFYQQDKIDLLNNLDENDDLCDENGERMKKFSRFAARLSVAVVVSAIVTRLIREWYIRAKGIKARRQSGIDTEQAFARLKYRTECRMLNKIHAETIAQSTEFETPDTFKTHTQMNIWAYIYVYYISIPIPNACNLR